MCLISDRMHSYPLTLRDSEWTKWYSNVMMLLLFCISKLIDHGPWHFHLFRRHHTAVNGESAQDGDDGDDKPRPVNRHIILIRHGQYNMEGASDKERALTELGQFVWAFYFKTP